MHRDLFAPPLLPGLAVRPDLVTPAEEAALVAFLETLPVAPFQFQGWEGKRQTASFGWRYDFNTARFGPADPIPADLLPLRDKVAAVAGLAAHDFVQALVIRYDPGAGIGWHRDRPVFAAVAGVSLAGDATIRFRRRRPAGGFDRFALPSPPRSAYVLSGEARHEWEHSIAPLPEKRWSVTFRSLAPVSPARRG